jgi:hypothetical protein
VHVGLDLLHHLDRAGGAGHDPGAQAGQVELAETGCSSSAMNIVGAMDRQ